MSGIAGIIDFQQKINSKIIEAMIEQLAHRGPDAAGIEKVSTPLYQLYFGHRRLAIQDLSLLSNQPMWSADRKLMIVFNGEIYNYQALRQELSRENIVFKSQGDTEVVLEAYRKWGVACFNKFMGMWALAIYDEAKQEVLLSRDRLGVKPLFYAQNQEHFAFASEIKALLKNPLMRTRLNRDAAALFFSYNYIPGEQSIFSGIKKFKPGCYLRYSLPEQKIIKYTQYWSLAAVFQKTKLVLSENEVLKQLEARLSEAIKSRLVSDVPVGLFLSSGYDSSLVAAIAQRQSTKKIKTFTIGVDDPHLDESRGAREIARYLGTDHHEYICSTKELIELIPKMAHVFDEPFGDSSCIPTFLVAQQARHHVKVALSADAGDELFAGYDIYQTAYAQYEKLRKVPGLLKKIMAASVLSANYLKMPIYNFHGKVLKLNALLRANSLLATHDANTRNMYEQDIAVLVGAKPLNVFKTLPILEGQDHPIQQLLYATTINYLCDDILAKVDRCTMSVGLEGREPFLDYRLVEFAARLPVSQKLAKGETKYLLKKIAHSYIPEKYFAKRKKGFSIPINTWLKGDLLPLVNDYLSPALIKKQGILNPLAVQWQLDNFLNRNGSGYPVWSLLVFQLWVERWKNKAVI